MLRSLAVTFVLTALTLVTATDIGSVAFAHGGDHSHMSVVELASHLSANWDHRSTIVAIGGAFALAAALVLLTGKKRAR
jgi:hypothetical protein